MSERWAADPEHIASAVERLRQGAVIAFPTDTLYAIAARAADPAAVARLYHAKRRPASQPLIWLVDTVSRLEPYALVDAQARQLMRRYWPGPLTLVLPARSGAGTLAVRAPNHPVAQALLSQLGEPVASSSANRAAAAPPVDASAVLEGLGEDLDLVVDGGSCQIGVASTILDLSAGEPRILREGAIPAAELI